MWGSIHENSMSIGFSPRKAEFSLYVSSAVNESILLLKKLEKCKMGKRVVISKNCLTLTLSPWNK